MSTFTTHVLDTALGLPADGVALLLERRIDGKWREEARAATDADGRARFPEAKGQAGEVWALTFETGSYFEAQGQAGFYPRVRVEFEVTDPTAHHHVPLLLSPFGYSTYRGS